MTIYEYSVLDLDDITLEDLLDKLDDMGSRGWKLVTACSASHTASSDSMREYHYTDKALIMMKEGSQSEPNG